MYSVSGLVYRILTVGCLMLIIGIICLITSKFWMPTKRKIPFLMIAICILIFSVSYISVYIYKTVNPSIATCEGTFIREYTDSSQAPFSHSYIFDVGQSEDKRVYLDSFSKKRIFSEDFQKGDMYKITFEKDTWVILHVEKIS